MVSTNNAYKTQQDINEIQKRIVRFVAENKITAEEWNKELIHMFKLSEKK